MTTWTDDKVARLKEMHARRCSTADIAEAVGTTRNAVIGKTSRLGISIERVMTKWPPERVNVLKDLWAAGRSATQIGKVLGITRKSITQKALRLKLPKREMHASVRQKAENNLTGRPNKPGRIAFSSGRFSTLKNGLKLPPKPPPLAPDQKEYILGQGVPLNDSVMEIVGQGKQASIRWSGGLQPGQCKWVINAQERGGEYLFCGTKALDGCVYCGEHERRATA